MTPTTPLRRLTVVAGLVLATLHLKAQTAPNPPNELAGGLSNEVTTLPTFDVGASSNHGYTSDQTTTGTRIASNLRDLPFSVSTVTSDFINDFAAFEFNDQVSNITSLAISEVQGQYVLRGFPITTQLVDGFRRLGLIDSVNIDRIDVIKGPAASIYGYIQPGGVVNITTKKPLETPEAGVAVFGGDYGFYRAQGYASGPMDKANKWFYRVDLADESRDYQQMFKSLSRYYGAFQVLYKPDDNTSLNLKIDDTFQHEHRGNQLIYIKDASSTIDPYRIFPSGADKGQNETISSYYLGLAYPNNPYNAALYNFNNSGPEEFNDRGMQSGTLTFEHRFNDVFSLREGFNVFSRSYERLYVDGLNYSIPAAAITGQAPEHDYEPQRNLANQIDLTAKFTTGPVSNQVLLTVDFSQETDRIQDLRMDATNAALQPVSTLNPNAPNWAFTTYKQDPALYDSAQANTWDRVDDYGLFLNEHASMFEDRLNLVAGVRLDTVDTDFKDYAAYNYFTGVFSEADLSKRVPYTLSHQIGVSYRIVDPLTFFANQSNSFNPQPNYVAGSGALSPNTTSKGFEYGAKVSMSDSLAFTLTHYEVYQYNSTYQVTTTEGAASVTDYINIAKQVSRGDEFELSWNPTKDFQLITSYSYDQATILQSNPEQLFLVGTSTRRAPEDQFSTAARYQFGGGVLKGLYFVANERYYSKSSVNISGGRTATGSGYYNFYLPNGLLPWPNLPEGVAVPVNLTTRLAAGGNPAAATIDPNLVRLPDGREKIFNQPFWLTDIGFGYEFKSGKFGHTVQVNLKNLFNRQYTYGSGIAGDPFTYVVSYMLTF